MASCLAMPSLGKGYPGYKAAEAACGHTQAIAF
jgi:hypothetical protein